MALILQTVGVPECSKAVSPAAQASLLPQEQTDSSHPPFASQNPEMPLSFSRCRVIRLLLLYYLGLLPFIPIPEKFLLCFLPTIINRYLQGPSSLLHPPPGFQLLLSLETRPPISSPIL